MQAALRAPPQHVLGRARPLLLDEVAYFALGQPGAVVLADAAVAEHGGSFDAMAAEGATDDGFRQVAIALEDFVASHGAPGEFASGELDMRRPWAFHRREMGRQLLQGLLGEATIRSDLAAEYRQ